MMRLSTLPVFMEEGRVRVYWSTGLVRNGYVDVKTVAYSKDVEVLAELIAIRHLLFHVQFFDRKLLWGSGIELTVASEEILHLFDRTSRKAHLYPYFRYVPACLEQIKICLKCPFVDEVSFAYMPRAPLIQLIVHLKPTKIRMNFGRPVLASYFSLSML